MMRPILRHTTLLLSLLALWLLVDVSGVRAQVRNTILPDSTIRFSPTGAGYCRDTVIAIPRQIVDSVILEVVPKGAFRLNTYALDTGGHELVITYCPPPGRNGELDSAMLYATVVGSSRRDSVELRGRMVRTKAVPFDSGAIDFGLVRIGDTVTRIDTFINGEVAGVMRYGVAREIPFEFSPRLGNATPIQLAPDAKQLLQVRYHPRDTICDDVPLRIESNVLGYRMVRVIGCGGRRVLSRIPDTLKFGLVPAGGTMTAVFDIANIGDFRTDIGHRIVGDDERFSFEGPLGIVDLDTSKSQRFTFRFTARKDDTAGVYFAIDSIITNADVVVPSRRVVLMAIVPSPALLVHPDAIHFGVVDSKADSAVRIFNEGGTTARIDNVRLSSGSSPRGFRIGMAAAPPIVIGPQRADSSITVSFSPLNYGRASDTLLLYRDGEVIASIWLSGQGRPGQVVDGYDTLVDFDDVLVNNDSSITIELRLDGPFGSKLVSAGIKSSGGNTGYTAFDYSPKAPVMLNRGSNRITFTFTPRSEGPHEATWSGVIEEGQEVRVRLKGNGRKASVDTKPTVSFDKSLLPMKAGEPATITLKVNDFPNGAVAQQYFVRLRVPSRSLYPTRVVDGATGQELTYKDTLQGAIRTIMIERRGNTAIDLSSFVEVTFLGLSTGTPSTWIAIDSVTVGQIRIDGKDSLDVSLEGCDVGNEYGFSRRARFSRAVATKADGLVLEYTMPEGADAFVRLVNVSGVEVGRFVLPAGTGSTQRVQVPLDSVPPGMIIVDLVVHGDHEVIPVMIAR